MARTTEGSGLGLSIAKSLTELQDGVFEVVIDGDLFKAMVSFPIMRAEHKLERGTLGLAEAGADGTGTAGERMAVAEDAEAMAAGSGTDGTETAGTGTIKSETVRFKAEEPSGTQADAVKEDEAGFSVEVEEDVMTSYTGLKD